MDKKELNELRKDIQKKISETKMCWICGRDNILTDHHAIPQRILSPRMNLLIPICKNCQAIIHNGDELLYLIKKIFYK